MVVMFVHNGRFGCFVILFSFESSRFYYWQLIGWCSAHPSGSGPMKVNCIFVEMSLSSSCSSPANIRSSLF